LAMTLVQVGFAGLNLVSKLALDSGMNPFVLVAYRQIFATLCTAPFAYFWERKMKLKITRSVLFQLFLCSIFGYTLNQCLYFAGLLYTTPTIACALQNLLPAITFIMAVPFRLETVGIKTLGGKAKVTGTILCVCGAMFMTFYKGKLINIFESGVHWAYPKKLEDGHKHSSSELDTILGSALLVGSCFAWAIWFIMQAKLSKTFAAPYTGSAIMCFMSSIQCVIVGACVDRESSGWALGWNIRLIASTYTGIVASGISFSVMNWCIQVKGPLFVSMFNPLLLIMVAVMGWALLDEKLYVGSAVGSVLIIVGLYAVLWGKGKEENKFDNDDAKTLKDEDEEVGGIVLPVFSKAMKEGENGEEEI